MLNFSVIKWCLHDVLWASEIDTSELHITKSKFWCTCPDICWTSEIDVSRWYMTDQSSNIHRTSSTCQELMSVNVIYLTIVLTSPEHPWHVTIYSQCLASKSIPMVSGYNINHSNLVQNSDACCQDIMMRSQILMYPGSSFWHRWEVLGISVLNVCTWHIWSNGHGVPRTFLGCHYRPDQNETFPDVSERHWLLAIHYLASISFRGN